MKITITEKGNEDFYKEVLNVSVQYRKLLKKPESKIQDQFQSWKRIILFDAIFLVVYIASMFLFEVSPFMWAIIFLLIFLGILSVVMFNEYNKRLQAMLEEDGSAELIIDEQGVELVKASLTVKLTWENIAFARILKESICFIPKTEPALVIGVSTKYLAEIKPYIQSRIIEASN